MTVVLITKDLMFSSRVSGAANRLDLSMLVVGSFDDLHTPVEYALVDLTTPGLDINELVTNLRQLAPPPKSIIAYGPHVQEERLAAATAAGCDLVLTRGQFDRQLPELLAEIAGN